PVGHGAEISDARPDAVYGHVVRRCLRALGIRDRPTAPRSPWQNPCVERLIGSVRRECLDHVIVFGEAHLHRIVALYASYYTEARTRPSLAKDAPIADRSNSLVALLPSPWSALCIIATLESSFR